MQRLRTAARTMAVGFVGGAFGSAAGVGGGMYTFLVSPHAYDALGVIMIPMLTRLGINMTQHQAHAASLAAVVATGTMGAVGYAMNDRVDYKAAGTISCMAIACVHFGTRVSFRLNSKNLSRVFGFFLTVVGPTVPLLHSQMGSDFKKSTAQETPYTFLGSVGAGAGFASGLLGVGGGVIITPLLALFTPLSQHTVIGTSLAAMVLPSMLALVSYYRQGAVIVPAAAALAGGAVAGAGCGVLSVMHVEEQPLRWVFAVVLTLSGLRMLFK